MPSPPSPPSPAPAWPPAPSALVYDWNARRRQSPLASQPLTFLDETLRDGLQGPSLIDPPIEAKRRILELADALGIQFADVGLPGAGPRAAAHTRALVEHIRDRHLSIRPCCAARTHADDIEAVVRVQDETGVPLEVMAFLGTSPIRLYVEGWDAQRLLALSSAAFHQAERHGLRLTFVTEDTARSHPDVLTPLFKNAFDHGVTRLCLTDTVGHATPDGVRNLVEFTRDLVERSGVSAGLDWHGHNDRGLALTNSIIAIEYGVDRVHGTALGIGERVGNARLDQILVNLKLLGEIEQDLSHLTQWCHEVARATGLELPPHYPILGGDAFRTATGVHAAAILKANRLGDRDLADRIYSGVPASLFGLRQRVEVGPMSGVSNVLFWLEEHGHPADRAVAHAVLARAKDFDRVLMDAELEALVREAQGAARTAR